MATAVSTVKIFNRWGGMIGEFPGADIREALSNACSSRANLTGANLTRADLTGADLTRANLTRANLTDANLTRANLTAIRDDLWAVLSSAPGEVEGVRLALLEGRVDGSSYLGACACLVGTIAKIRGVHHADLGALRPNGSRPAEMWFLGIHEGDTPETNSQAAQAVEWIDEWLSGIKAAFQKGRE